MITVTLLLAVLSFQTQTLRKLEAAPIILNLTNVDFAYYYTTIKFGDTTYTLKVHTGVNFITLPSDSQATCHTTNRFTCNPSTCTKSASEITKEYVPGKSMTGYIATDDFTLGEKAISDMKFLLTTSEVGFEDYKCDGMLGLNYASFFESENSGLMYDLLNQGIVPLKQVGLYLSTTANDSTSQLILGGYDTTKAVNTKWFPVSSDYWTVQLTGYKVGSSKSLQNDTIIFATEYAYTYVPTNVFIEYTGQVKKKYSSCDYYMDSKLFGCVVKNLDDINGFPDISIFIGEEEIKILHESFVYSLKIGDYYVAVALLKQVDDNVWIAGTSFMDDRYMIFNAENKTIGISSGGEGKFTLGILLVLLISLL